MDRDEYAAFAASMPASYREAFDEEAFEAHAAVASRREGSATRVEIWKDLPERVVAICIIADDRPGLLSQISAALVAEHIDVVSAHAYCRTTRAEAGLLRRVFVDLKAGSRFIDRFGVGKVVLKSPVRVGFSQGALTWSDMDLGTATPLRHSGTELGLLICGGKKLFFTLPGPH